MRSRQSLTAVRKGSLLSRDKFYILMRNRVPARERHLTGKNSNQNTTQPNEPC